ncbi:ankyrin repeat-containing domain protein [Diplogelasinospora grovesii]|uniref:Ankyrin repeat-containing domain protein n=1 Tax=Diplogelasinospora grovesii TaxID=303347 RepID=A0AAN6MYS9_9PEZI|nr:ankyrin repeat-containing domain protein [Diplogelasinospora grovesii]
MDVVSVIAGCASVAKAVAQTVSTITDLVNALNHADRNISRLAIQLGLFKETVSQLQSFIKKGPILSANLQQTILSSLHGCEDIIKDIEEHANKVRVLPGETQTAFQKRFRKIRHVWSEKDVLQDEAMLTRQFQMLDFFIRSVQLNHSDQDSILESAPIVSVIQQTEADAFSVRTMRRNRNEEGGSTAASVLDDMEFGLDNQILRSGAYVRHYRQLVLRESSSSEKTPQSIVATTVTAVAESSAATTVEGSSSVSPIEDRLLMACQNNNPKLLKEALDAGASINMPIKRTFRATALQLAAENSLIRLDFIKKLITHGADINQKDERDQSPLHTALLNSRPDVASILITKDADIEVEDREGRRPLHIAIQSSNYNIASLLLSKGADANAQAFNVAQHSPLHCGVHW